MFGGTPPCVQVMGFRWHLIVIFREGSKVGLEPFYGCNINLPRIQDANIHLRFLHDRSSLRRQRLSSRGYRTEVNRGFHGLILPITYIGYGLVPHREFLTLGEGEPSRERGNEPIIFIFTGLDELTSGHPSCCHYYQGNVRKNIGD